MSLPKDLGEYTDAEIRRELYIRKVRRLAGRCCYCNRDPDTPTCKFPARHCWPGPPEEPQ